MKFKVGDIIYKHMPRIEDYRHKIVNQLDGKYEVCAMVHPIYEVGSIRNLNSNYVDASYELDKQWIFDNSMKEVINEDS